MSPWWSLCTLYSPYARWSYRRLLSCLFNVSDVNCLSVIISHCLLILIKTCKLIIVVDLWLLKTCNKDGVAFYLNSGKRHCWDRQKQWTFMWRSRQYTFDVAWMVQPQHCLGVGERGGGGGRGGWGARLKQSFQCIFQTIIWAFSFWLSEIAQAKFTPHCKIA